MSGKTTLFMFFLASLAMSAGCQSKNAFADYNAELQYWRELPYPRVEKLMDVHNGSKIASMRVYPSKYEPIDVQPNEINEDNYAVVIEYHTTTNRVPSVNEIYKRENTPAGKITRKARLTALGQLEWEQEYLNGKPYGTWRSWYPNGQIFATQSYSDGVLEGEALTFSAYGKLLQKCVNHQGKAVDAWEVSENGKWVQTCKNGTGTIADFNDDGSVDGGFYYENGVALNGAH